jgi:hypothetical protein
MRPTLTALRAWEPADLERRARDLDAEATALFAAVDVADTRVRDTVWSGVAAAAAVDRSDRERRVAATLFGDWEAAAAALRSGSAEIGAAREVALGVADEAAERLGFVVSDSGRVTAPVLPWVGVSLSANVIRILVGECARWYDARIAAALDAVDAADRALALALREIVGDPAAPPVGSTADENARYWTGLTEDQRRTVLAQHPARVGNLDGLPGSVRDAANRAVLDADRRECTQLLERIEQQGLYRETSGTAGKLALIRASAARARLEELDAVAAAIADPDRRLLVYRGGGEEIRAAVAVGNVDTADHVAVYTPGLNTTVRDDLDSASDAVAGLRDDAQRQLVDAGRADETVAAVVWLDYRPPQVSADDPAGAVRDAVVDLGLTAAARSGAAGLGAFTRGLDASRPDGVHLTAVGHSYGSTTTGIALQAGDIAVDDAVFLGSPGVGTGDVADLGLPPGHVYVGEADGDVVADLGAYGPDPSTLPGVTALATNDGPFGGESRGHSEYLEEGSTSRHNVGAVVAGLPDGAVTSPATR